MPLPDLHSSLRVVNNIPAQQITGQQTVTGEFHPEAAKQQAYLRDCYDAYVIIGVGSADSAMQVKLQQADDITVARPNWVDVPGAADVILGTEDDSQHIYKINLRGRTDGPYYRISIFMGGTAGVAFAYVSGTILAAWPKDNLLDGEQAMTQIDAEW